MLPWQTIDGIDTREGRMELRRRGERDFLITVGGRVLMTSAAHRSEAELASVACAAIASRPRAQVMIGGLGMGYTLRATLDALPPGGKVTVVELNATVIDWCRGPLAVLNGSALTDRRVKTVVRDVAKMIENARPGSWDAIVLDLYEGPHQATNRSRDPLYGRAALERSWAALAAGGVLAVWSEEPDKAFEGRLVAASFDVQRHASGRGGRTHTIYVATKAAMRRPAAARPHDPRPSSSSSSSPRSSGRARRPPSRRR